MIHALIMLEALQMLLCISMRMEIRRGRARPLPNLTTWEEIR